MTDRLLVLYNSRLAMDAPPAQVFSRAQELILNPDAIAANYVMLHKQPKSAWTHELDLRPWGEKW